MWLRKKIIRFYGVSKNTMNTIMQLKKASALNKGKELECFVLSTKSFENFFTKLNANLQEINNVRFQVAVKDENYGHWWMIDCYVKNGVLHTFSLDAGVLHETLTPSLKILTDVIPTGKHFSFYRTPDTTGIQSSSTHCPWYTREHISLISQMDPDNLYTMLEDQNNTNLAALDGKGPRNNLRTFKIEDLNDDMVMLAPLFRNMQSLSNVEKLPLSFKTAIASKSKNKTVDEYIENNKVYISTKNKSKEPVIKVQNQGIDNKENKTLSILSKSKVKFHNDRSGFGFVTFPILTRIKQNYLQHDELANIRKLTADLVLQLGLTPKTTKRASFLGIRAKHADKTEETINQLRDLYYSNIDDKAKYINHFCDIVYAYAGYLDKQNSVRTLALLKSCFTNYEKTFEKTFNSKIPLHSK